MMKILLVLILAFVSSGSLAQAQTTSQCKNQQVATLINDLWAKGSELQDVSDTISQSVLVPLYNQINTNPNLVKYCPNNNFTCTDDVDFIWRDWITNETAKIDGQLPSELSKSRDYQALQQKLDALDAQLTVIKQAVVGDPTLEQKNQIYSCMCSTLL